VQIDAHERLTMPTAALTAPRVDWEQDPSLEPVFNLVLGRIRNLAESGLTSMMVLHDYVLNPASMALHQGKRRHAAGAWRWVHTR
jgi:hypothetical protein